MMILFIFCLDLGTEIPFTQIHTIIATTMVETFSLKRHSSLRMRPSLMLASGQQQDLLTISLNHKGLSFNK